MEAIAKLAIVAGAAGGVFAAFKAVDETVSASAKNTFSTWLNQTTFSSDRTLYLHDVLHAIFDSAFGSDPFSRKFLVRSFLLSVIGAPCGLLFLYLLSKYFGAPSKAGIFLAFGSVPTVVAVVLLAVVAGFVGDYLSLLKSTLILQSTRFRDNYLKYYAVDVVVSVFLGVGWFIFVGAVTLAVDKVMSGGELFKHYLKDKDVFLISPLITTLFPTFLVFSFVVTASVAKFLVVIGRPLDMLKSKILDVTSKPFQSIGLLLAPIVAFLVALLLFRGGG